MTNKKDFTKEALKSMGKTAGACLVFFATAALVIGTPIAVAAVLDLNCQNAFCVGYILFMVMLLWFVAEYDATEKKYYEHRLK